MVRAPDHCARVVRDDQLRHTADEALGACTALELVNQCLGRRRTSEGVAEGAQRRHEDVDLAFVRQFDCGSGVLDKELPAGAVDLAHRALQCKPLGPNL